MKKILAIALLCSIYFFATSCTEENVAPSNAHDTQKGIVSNFRV